MDLVSLACLFADIEATHRDFCDLFSFPLVSEKENRIALTDQEIIVIKLSLIFFSPTIIDSRTFNKRLTIAILVKFNNQQGT